MTATFTSPAARGLFQAILADPSDDVPRLLLADVLEEEGDPRGEFIRVQCELATYPPENSMTLGIYGPERMREGRRLRRRERELLRDPINWWSWLADFYQITGRYAIADMDFRSEDANFAVRFRRGFVAAVTCTLADWHGEACQACESSTETVPTAVWKREFCPLCHGTGRTGGHGRALVLAAPLEQVTFADKHPALHCDFTGPTWHWQRSVGDGPIDVPPVLYDLLAGNRFTTGAQEARDALSRSALTWARQEAGLPALA